MTDERIEQIESMSAFEAWRDGIHELIAEVRRLRAADEHIDELLTDAGKGAAATARERDALRAEVERMRAQLSAADEDEPLREEIRCLRTERDEARRIARSLHCYAGEPIAAELADEETPETWPDWLVKT